MISNNKMKRVGQYLGALAMALLMTGAGADQRYFENPEQAAQALIDAASDDGDDALTAILGPKTGDLSSGDPVEDANGRQAFIDAAVEQAGIEQDGDDRATLVIGKDDWPFAIPLVKEPQGWRFDTDAGLEEIQNRLIGKNELYAIAVAEAYVDAQREYESEDRTGEGRQFAQKLKSSEGKRDGLYWPVVEGEPESPMGPLIAEAVAEGYLQDPDSGPKPYHGYFYRMLKAQGPNAPGGAKSYVGDSGRMTEGFGLVAWPADYGNSGVMTFIVNQQGVVFQKDLGEQTDQLAAAVTAYDPDAAWQVVTD